jgi:hypothetical protein
MLEIADEVVADRQIALVDRRDERQIVHVLDHGPRRVVDDGSGMTMREALDDGQRQPVGDLFAGVVEFFPTDKIHGGRGIQRSFRIHHGLRSHHADQHRRPLGLQHLGKFRIGRKRRSAGMQDHEFVVARDGEALLHRQFVGGRVEHPRVRHQRRGLRQPGRVPERFHLPFRLVARAGAAVEAVERGSLQEQRL